MDEPSKVIRERIHFSLLRAVISPENFRFPFDKTDAKPKGVGLRSLALSCLSWSLHVFLALNSHRLLLLFSYLMAGRCNDNLGVWFYGTRLKCALIRMVLVIKYDAKGFLPKEKIFVVVNFLRVPAMTTLVYRKTKLFLFLIQAHFRGQRVRRRLNEALRAAQFYDDEGEEEFDYDEEVDLTAFDFDENVLEQGWTPSETPQLPSRSVWLREESSYVCFSAVTWLTVLPLV